jgi:hypothetical protein
MPSDAEESKEKNWRSVAAKAPSDILFTNPIEMLFSDRWQGDAAGLMHWHCAPVQRSAMG